MEILDTLKRRPRMSRHATDKRIQLTDRDFEILRLLNRYRYLRSSHFHLLAGGKSKRRFVERLGHLYHEGGYVDRPAQQWQAINARYMPAVYELGASGESLLLERGLLDTNSPLLHRGRGNGFQFHHELMICDIIASIEIGIRKNPKLRFISWQEIIAKAPAATQRSGNPFEVPVSIHHVFAGRKQTSDKPLIPDALFGIEYTEGSEKSYRFFALEADRKSEPVVRTNLNATSYLRKLLQYREIIARRTYKTHWGLPNLLVLTVTTHEQHMKNIVALADELAGGKGSTFLLF
jgi:hypothetical protein